jgi:hypothetical protein
LQEVLLEKRNRLDRLGNRSYRFGDSKGVSLVFVLVRSLGLLQEVVVLVVGLESL